MSRFVLDSPVDTYNLRHLVIVPFIIKVLIADTILINQMVSYADHLFQGTNHSLFVVHQTRMDIL